MLKKMLVGLCVSAFLAAPVSAQQEVRPEGEGVLWAVDWAERNGECFVLSIGIGTKQFRLPLQFEVDDVFYNTDEITRRNKAISSFITALVRYDDFSDDEKAYWQQKTGEIGLKHGVVLGMELSMKGAAAIDQKYRSCLADFGIE